MQKTLKKYWGYDAFRPMQDEIIQSVLDGHDTLALLPTGGGKSICFQVPALMQEGICLVISPLIALMKDQVQNLKKRNIPAVAIYSGMHYREIDRAFDNAIYGNTKFLYLSPERLASDLARERIKRMKINLLAIDEAHCISQWGYDFRPSYLNIAEIREWLPNVPILALTATATPQVVEDIQEKLAFTKSKKVFQKSFVRDNLSYVVFEEEGKQEKMLDILRKVKGTGIVYVRNRRKTKEIALFLRKKGIAADFYHAGLSSDIRSQKQEAWTTNKIRIMVSTNAFGMGIDKPDVRVVIHLSLPDSLEAYFQEAGRGGRDGKRAYAVLLYDNLDKNYLEKSYEQSFPDMTAIRQVYRALGSYFQLATGGGKGNSYAFDIVEFAQTYKLAILQTHHCLKVLKDEGWIALTDSVFEPATLKVVVTQEDLYKYQVEHPKLDNLIRTILRTYQGSFANHIKINEKQLAKFIKLPYDILRNHLTQMAQEGIIEYIPQHEDPQLVFIRERVPAENLTINTQLYDFRKKRYHNNIQSAINYATTARCRSQLLLEYFAEKDAPECGICDVCLGRLKDKLSDKDFDFYKNKIQIQLQGNPTELKELVRRFSSTEEQQILKTIDYMLDNGFLRIDEDNMIYWKS